MNELVFLEPNDLNEIPFTTSNMGHVYIVENETGNIKIGRTVNPKLRIRAIETQSGIPITQTYISPGCSNYQKLESASHKEFSHFRIKGEWFSLSFNTAKNFISKLNFAPAIITRKEELAIFPPELDPRYVALETEILNSLISKMQSLRDEVIISNTKYGAIDQDLRKRASETTAIFDNLATDFKVHISSLIALDYDYKSIKDIISRKYLLTA